MGGILGGLGGWKEAGGGGSAGDKMKRVLLCGRGGCGTRLPAAVIAHRA